MEVTADECSNGEVHGLPWIKSVDRGRASAGHSPELGRGRQVAEVDRIDGEDSEGPVSGVTASR